MKHKQTKTWEMMTVEDGAIVRKKKTCKRCGEGVYMAEHKEKDGKIRYYCGKCQYTEWKQPEQKEKQPEKEKQPKS